MSIRNSLFFSASILMLATTAQANDTDLFYPTEISSSKFDENSSYQLAKVQFLPDYMEELGGNMNSMPGATPGNKIPKKGCMDGHQTSPCGGDKPFQITSYRAENGDKCYGCRAFDPQDCEKDGYYKMEHWNNLKPQASLSTPRHNLFAELFGQILGIRNAHAKIDPPLSSAMPDPGVETNTPVFGGDDATNGAIDASSTSTPVVCQISSRKILNEVVNGDYSFQVQKKCEFDADYVKGEWIATCDPKVYKYDESNCGYILAGKKCEGKWNHCARCHDLYSVEGNCTADYPGVYDIGEAANIADLNLLTCTKNAEGCLHSCSAANI